MFDVDNEFWIYVHDRGEEYYLHYDFWPTVPFIHRSVTNEYFSDIVVRKELEIHQDNCSEENYDYFGKFGIYSDLHICFNYSIKLDQFNDLFDRLYYILCGSNRLLTKGFQETIEKKSI